MYSQKPTVYSVTAIVSVLNIQWHLKQTGGRDSADSHWILFHWTKILMCSSVVIHLLICHNVCLVTALPQATFSILYYWQMSLCRESWWTREEEDEGDVSVGNAASWTEDTFEGLASDIYSNVIISWLKKVAELKIYTIVNSPSPPNSCSPHRLV